MKEVIEAIVPRYGITLVCDIILVINGKKPLLMPGDIVVVDKYINTYTNGNTNISYYLYCTNTRESLGYVEFHDLITYFHAYEDTLPTNILV